jgi:hypothetical protein
MAITRALTQKGVTQAEALILVLLEKRSEELRLAWKEACERQRRIDQLPAVFVGGAFTDDGPHIFCSSAAPHSSNASHRQLFILSSSAFIV